MGWVGRGVGAAAVTQPLATVQAALIRPGSRPGYANYYAPFFRSARWQLNHACLHAVQVQNSNNKPKRPAKSQCCVLPLSASSCPLSALPPPLRSVRRPTECLHSPMIYAIPRRARLINTRMPKHKHLTELTLFTAQIFA